MPKPLLLGALIGASLAALGCNNGPIVVPAIASGQNGATALVANGAYLYWGMPAGEIRRVAIDGGSKVETIVDGIKTPAQIAVDDDNVYFATIDGDIGAAPKTGGAPSILSRFEDATIGITSDGEHLFWARATGEVKKVDTNGDNLDGIATDASGPTSFGRQGPTLYLTTGDAKSGAVKAVAGDASKSSEATLAAGTLSPQHLAVTSQLAIWSALDPDALGDDPNSSVRLVTRSSLEGDSQQVLWSGFQNIGALAADEDKIYVASDDLDTATVDVHTNKKVVTHTSIVSFANTGSTPSEIVRGPLGRVHVSTDDTSIYWLFEADGVIGSASKALESGAPPAM